MSLIGMSNNAFDRVTPSPSREPGGQDIWQEVFRNEIEPRFRQSKVTAGQASPEITPFVTRPVMYAQVGELPELPPPTTDAPTEPPRPRLTPPSLEAARSVLERAQQTTLPDGSRVPSHIQQFIAREVGVAALEDAFRTRTNTADAARPGYCDGAIAALEGTLRHMRQGRGTGWQIEAGITQALLGFAQLHRSGIGDSLNATTVGQSQQAGGDRARFANNGLQNIFEARQALERLLNPQGGSAPPAEPVRQEIQRILSALPAVTHQDGQYRLTGNANRDALMQLAQGHDIGVFRRWIQELSRR